MNQTFVRSEMVDALRAAITVERCRQVASGPNLVQIQLPVADSSWPG